MGRLQHLERLALGRSPFQDPDPEERVQEHGGTGSSATPNQELHHAEAYQQQYDNKGRPINSRTEKRNAELRNAQNAVLALVGVVESKEESDRVEQTKYRPLREARDKLLKAEQDRGNDLALLAQILHRSLTWWPEALLARIQAGLYPSSLSFGEVIACELNGVRHAGLAGFVATFLPGMPAYALCNTVDNVLYSLLEQFVGRMIAMLSRNSSRRTAKYTLTANANANEVIALAITGFLMPFEYYAETQRLGLAPAWPVYPSWRLLHPTGQSLTHPFIWTTPLAMSRLGILASPGLWLLLRNYLYRDQGEEAPVAAQLTSFRYPTINAPRSSANKPNICTNPLGRVLYHGYKMRVRVLRWFGWELERTDERFSHVYLDNRLRPHAVDTSHRIDCNGSNVQGGNEVDHAYRSTLLSQLPARFLAERLDELFGRLLILPLESMVVRAVTLSYLTSPLIKTSLGVTASQSFYMPFGGGPLATLRAHSSSATVWGGVGGYLSKLGLSLALYCSAEIGTFFVIYGLCRWQGVRNFSWSHESRARKDAQISAPG